VATHVDDPRLRIELLLGESLFAEDVGDVSVFQIHRAIGHLSVSSEDDAIVKNERTHRTSLFILPEIGQNIDPKKRQEETVSALSLV
jgi:hypothetical protein